MAKINAIRTQIVNSLVTAGLVKRVYGIVARNVEAADLPAAIVVPTAVRYEDFGDSLVRATITFTITVLTHIADYGVEGENEASAIDEALSVLRHFRARPGIEINSGVGGIVYDVKVSANTPLQLINYGGQEFLGSTITLEVDDLESFEYRD